MLNDYAYRLAQRSALVGWQIVGGLLYRLRKAVGNDEAQRIYNEVRENAEREHPKPEANP